MGIGGHSGLILRGAGYHDNWLTIAGAAFGTIYLVEYIAGVQFFRATAAFTPVQGQTYLYEFIDDGTTLTVKIDGTTMLTYSSSSQASQTQVGLYGYNPGVAGSLGIFLNDFRVSV